MNNKPRLIHLTHDRKLTAYISHNDAVNMIEGGTPQLTQTMSTTPNNSFSVIFIKPRALNNGHKHPRTKTALLTVLRIPSPTPLIGGVRFVIVCILHHKLNRVGSDVSGAFLESTLLSEEIYLRLPGTYQFKGSNTVKLFKDMR